MTLDETDEIVSADLTLNPLEVICASTECEVIRYRASDVKLYGKNASGIKSMKLKDGEELVSAHYANKNDDVLLLTNRGYIKRIKVEDLTLSQRGRAGIRQIKKVKSNPFILNDMCIMTPNQYKEGVNINICYEEKNDLVNTKDLKYNLSDAGKEIIKNGLGTPLKMYINEPSEKDEVVNGDYLLDTTQSIDLFNYNTLDDEPIKVSKKEKDPLDLIDQILQKEETKQEIKDNNIVNMDTLDKLVTENNDSTITKTKSSVIVKKKKISFFDED